MNGDFYVIPLLPLLGVNNFLPLVHMSENIFIWIERETDESIFKLDIWLTLH